MIGWVGDKEGSPRYALLEQVFGKKPVEFPTLDEALKSDSPNLKALLLSESLYSEAYKGLKYIPENILLTGFIDGFLKEHDRYVPKCAYLDSFPQFFAKHSKFIDNSKGVLFVGDYEPCRAALISLFKLGFNQFYVLEGAAESLFTQSVKRLMFGVKLESISVADLVNLSGQASVVLHGVSQADKVVGERELSYLNFLSRPGLLVDFLPDGFLSQVVNETQDEGLVLFDGNEIGRLTLAQWKAKLKA